MIVLLQNGWVVGTDRDNASIWETYGKAALTSSCKCRQAKNGTALVGSVWVRARNANLRGWERTSSMMGWWGWSWWNSDLRNWEWMTAREMGRRDLMVGYRKLDTREMSLAMVGGTKRKTKVDGVGMDVVGLVVGRDCAVQCLR